MVNEKGMPSLADGTAGNDAGRGRTLWLDCQAGVAGDMLVAALIDAAEDSEAAERAVRATLAALPVEGFSLDVTLAEISGLSTKLFIGEVDEALFEFVDGLSQVLELTKGSTFAHAQDLVKNVSHVYLRKLCAQ